MAHRQTSDDISALAARYLNFRLRDLDNAVEGDAGTQLTADIRRLAASCLAQDETKGQRKAAKRQEEGTMGIHGSPAVDAAIVAQIEDIAWQRGGLVNDVGWARATCKRSRDQRYFAVTVLKGDGTPQTTLTIVAPDTIARPDDIPDAVRSWIHKGMPDTHIATPELMPPIPPDPIEAEPAPKPATEAQQTAVVQKVLADNGIDERLVPPKVTDKRDLSPAARRMRRVVRPVP